MTPYNKEEELIMKKFYESLDEANKRRYAALESMKLGHGGKKYIKELFSTSYDSLSKGLTELSQESVVNQTGRVRKVGGGRKLKKTIKK